MIDPAREIRRELNDLLRDHPDHFVVAPSRIPPMADAVADGLIARLGARIAVSQDGGRLTIRAVAGHPLVAKLRITRTHVEFRFVSTYRRLSRRAHHSVAARGDRIDRIVAMLAGQFQVEQLLATVS